MEFKAWLTANGYDAEKLTDKQRVHLEAAWKAETQPKPDPKPEPKAEPTSFDEKMAAITAENERQDYIRAATVAASERHIGDTEKLKQIRELSALALADKKMDKRGFDFAMLQIARMLPTQYGHPGATDTTDTILEAAICAAHRLPNIEKHFSDQTLQMAHTRYRRGVGLQEMILIAAERNNGYRGSPRDTRAMCRAAFKVADFDGYGMRADAGPSTISVPGILSNVANKFLAASFLYTEQAWRGFAKISSANDFKTMTTYRLTGSNTFEKVAPGGEIKHGTLSELSYTNKVDTYGKMLGIDRRDIVNDDLGAFASATNELGRGAGDSLNSVFWAEWTDDSTFFPTDKSKNNYDDGTDTVLGIAGLNNIETIFRLQTKPDGTPLGIMPAILLVPATLYNTALQLMAPGGLVVGTTPASGPAANVFTGRYRIVSSVFLDAVATIGTTAWYLLADPNNVAAIEVAFLMGQDSPVVETSEFDFDRLGLAMRAYMDFGCSKMEYRAGVKAKGTT